MADAILIARSGLADALFRQSGLAGASLRLSGLVDASLRLDKAAVNVVKATAPVQVRPRDGAPVTGATGAPSGSSGDVATAFLDLMSAEMSFKANVEVLKTQANMVRSLYDALD